MILKVKEVNSTWTDSVYFYDRTITTADELDPLIEPVKNLKTTGSISEKDTVYFHSSSKIPRYKFSDFCDGKDIRRVINIDKATAAVVNLDVIKSAISRSAIGEKNKYYTLPNDFFSTHGIKPKNYGATSIVINPTDILVCTKRGYEGISNNFKNISLPDISIFSSNSYYTTQRYNTVEQNKAWDSINDLNKMIKSNIKIVDDNVLNKQMSIGKLNIDETNFDEICQMLAATDPSAVTTAIELIANSDYVESQFYISLLLNRFATQFNIHATKSVNIRNFIEYFKGIQWSDSRPRFISSLRDHLIKNSAMDEQKDRFIRNELLEFTNLSLKSYGIIVKDIYFKGE